MQDSILQKNEPVIDNRAVFPILPGRDVPPPFAEPPNQFETLKSPSSEFTELPTDAKPLAAASGAELVVNPGDQPSELPTSSKSDNRTTDNGAEAMSNPSSHVELASNLAASPYDALQTQEYDPFSDDSPADNPPADNPPADKPPANQDQPINSEQGQPAQEPAFDPFDSVQNPEKVEPENKNDFQPIPSTAPPTTEPAPTKVDAGTQTQDPSSGQSNTISEIDGTALPQPPEPRKESVSVSPKAAANNQSAFAEWEPLLRWLIPALLLLVVAGLAWFLLRGRRRRTRKSSSSDQGGSAQLKKGFVKRGKGETMLDSGLVDETPESGFANTELDSYLEPYDAEATNREAIEDDSDFQFLEEDEIPPREVTSPPVQSSQEADDDQFDFSDFDEPDSETTMDSNQHFSDVPARSGVSQMDQSVEFDDDLDLMDMDEIDVETDVDKANRPGMSLEVASQLVDSRMEAVESLTIEGESREVFERPSLKEMSESDRKKSFFSRLINKDKGNKDKGNEAELRFEDSTPTVPSTDLDQFEIVEEDLGQLFDGYEPAQIQPDAEESFGNPALLNTSQVSSNGSMQDLQRSIAFLQDENTKLATRLKTAEQELDSFSEQQIQQLRELSLEQQNQIADLEQSRTELVTVRTEQEQLLRENSQLKLELSGLQEKHVSISADEISVRSGYDHSKDDLSEKLNASLTFQAALEAELDAIRKEKTEWSSVLEEQKIALDSTADLSVRIEELRQQLKQAQLEKTEAADQINQLKLAENEWRERQSSFEVALEQEKSVRQMLMTRIDEQQQAISSSNHQESRLSELENQIARSNQENETLKLKLVSLEHNLQNSVATNTNTDKSTLDREVKLKFTRLYNSYEKERKLRMEANEQLEQAEQQIVSMRNLIKSLQEKLH